MADGTDPAIGRVVVVLFPAGKVSTFVGIHTVRCVPVVITGSPRHVCKTDGFQGKIPSRMWSPIAEL